MVNTVHHGRLKDFGNARAYALWEDESYNRNLALIATSVHAATFEKRLLKQAVQAARPKKQRTS